MTGSVSGSFGCQAQPSMPPSRAATNPSTRRIAANATGLPSRAAPFALTSRRAACRQRGGSFRPSACPARTRSVASSSRTRSRAPGASAPSSSRPSPATPHQPGSPASRTKLSSRAAQAGSGACRESASTSAATASCWRPAARCAAARPSHASLRSWRLAMAPNRSAAAGSPARSRAVASAKPIVSSVGAKRAARSSQRRALGQRPAGERRLSLLPRQPRLLGEEFRRGHHRRGRVRSQGLAAWAARSAACFAVPTGGGADGATCRRARSPAASARPCACARSSHRRASAGSSVPARPRAR